MNEFKKMIFKYENDNPFFDYTIKTDSIFEKTIKLFVYKRGISGPITYVSDINCSKYYMDLSKDLHNYTDSIIEQIKRCDKIDRLI